MRNYLETYSPDRLFTLPRRGLRVVAPPTSQVILQELKVNGKNGHPIWSEQEKARISLLRDCRILRRRYPTAEAGRQFMDQVSTERREDLFRMAQDLTTHIVEKWQEVKSDKHIAVILFGSVAKGLVKNVDHPDPSNIDLAVMGDITDKEREELMEKIRPRRLEMRKQIRSVCPNIDTKDETSGNAGVIIQNSKKVRNGEFGPALNYIASGAIALYDPEGIWEKIENAALNFQARKLFGRGNFRRK